MNTHILKRVLGFFLLLGVSFSSLATTAFAESREGDNVIVGVDEIINEDLFIAGEQVEILGEVNGDVYIAADSVDVRGLINGDLIVAAESITVTGTLNDDIRVFGKVLTLTGATLNDGVTFLGERLILDSDTTVNGTVLFLGDTFIMDGVLNGDVRGAGDTFVINGEVTKSLYLATRVLDIRDEAVVNGDVRYLSENEAVIASGAVVSGEVNKRNVSMSEWKGAWSWAESVFAFLSFLGALVTGIVLLLIFYRPVVGVSERIRERPLLSLGMGSLVFLLAFPIFVLLAVTVVGVPLAFLFLTAFFVGLCLSKIFVALALGRFFIETLRPRATPPSAYLSFIVGLISLYLLYQLPLVGWAINFLVALMGLGALLYGVQRIRRDWA